jgi:hypothetical protein
LAELTTYLAVVWGIGLTDVQLAAQVGTSICVFVLAAIRLGREVKRKEKENNKVE